jgi:hypothetical protein
MTSAVLARKYGQNLLGIYPSDSPVSSLEELAA